METLGKSYGPTDLSNIQIKSLIKVERERERERERKREREFKKGFYPNGKKYMVPFIVVFVALNQTFFMA